MVDIHSHILWGMDDGAKTLDDSLAMLRLAAETGTTDIVATPHANHRYSFDPELITSRLDELRAAAVVAPRLHRGADFHLSVQNIDSAFETPSKFAINHKNYLLVEFPDEIIPSGIGRVFEGMHDLGLIPVITHPERNRVLRQEPGLLREWVDRGCTLQITAQSLEGRFGRDARMYAWSLLREENVHFIASDGHDLEHRPPRLDHAFRLVEKEMGIDVARHLFLDNPFNALNGKPLHPFPKSAPGLKSGGWRRLFSGFGKTLPAL